jgi:hypothetical protein
LDIEKLLCSRDVNSWLEFWRNCGWTNKIDEDGGLATSFPKRKQPKFLVIRMSLMPLLQSAIENSLLLFAAWR